MPHRRKGSPFWWYDLTIRGRRFRGSTETDRLETAKLIEAKLRSDLLLGTVTGARPATLTLSQALGRYWLDHAQHLRSAATLRYQARELIAGLGADRTIDAFTNNDLALYAARRRARVTSASVNREITLLRAVLNMARDRWGKAVARLNWKAQRLREPAPRRRYLSADEAQRLIAAAPEHLQGPITMALCTGLRLAAVATLDWRQIDLPGRRITITLKSKRTGERHTVPLAQPLLVVLANLGPRDEGPVWWWTPHNQHRQRRDAAGRPARPQPLRSWKRSFATACSRAGIEDFRWHDLRHTAASWMVQEGVPLDVVQRILGHASMTTTLRYAHRADHAERDAVATLGRAMGAALASALPGHSPIPGHKHDTLGEDEAPQSAPKSLAHKGK